MSDRTQLAANRDSPTLAWLYELSERYDEAGMATNAAIAHRVYEKHRALLVERESLREERDSLRNQKRSQGGLAAKIEGLRLAVGDERDRAEAAERERVSLAARLTQAQEALRRIAAFPEGYTRDEIAHGYTNCHVQTAREALAVGGEEPAATEADPESTRGR